VSETDREKGETFIAKMAGELFTVLNDPVHLRSSTMERFVPFLNKFGILSHKQRIYAGDVFVIIGMSNSHPNFVDVTWRGQPVKIGMRVLLANCTSVGGLPPGVHQPSYRSL